MSKTKILAIDDESAFTTLMSEFLQEDYDFFIANTGEEGVSCFETIRPDIVLLDIKLGDKDGFTVCKEIKEIDVENLSSVVFVSGVNSNDERIRAYEVGGDDYISKPLKPSVFLANLAAIERFQRDKKALRGELAYTRDTAMQCMREASQYGTIVGFIKNSFLSENYEKLAELVFDYFNELGINSCLQFRLQKGDWNTSPSGKGCSPIEEQIFELMRHKDRILQFNSRMLINYEHISILVKNMPTDDEVLCGRYRDLLAVLGEAIEARIMDLQRNDALTMVIDSVSTISQRIESQFVEHQKRTIQIMEHLMMELSDRFHVLDLSDEQEKSFVELVEASMDRLLKLYNEGRLIDEQFEILQKMMRYHI